MRLQDNSVHSVSGTIELFTYHTVVQNHRWAIAIRQLFNGTWKAPTLSRLVWTMYINFVLRNDFIDYPDTDTIMNSCTGVNSNVIISDDETVVYKVFDDRYRKSKSYRHWLASVANIDNCEIVVASGDERGGAMGVDYQVPLHPRHSLTH